MIYECIHLYLIIGIIGKGSLYRHSRLNRSHDAFFVHNYFIQLYVYTLNTQIYMLTILITLYGIIVVSFIHTLLHGVIVLLVYEHFALNSYKYKQFNWYTITML